MIGTSQFILDVIREGYRIPMHSTPHPSLTGNNKSALAHATFVEETLSEVLVTKLLFQTDAISPNVTPSSVSVQPSGKERLILDLIFTKSIFGTER